MSGWSLIRLSRGPPSPSGVSQKGGGGGGADSPATREMVQMENYILDQGFPTRGEIRG